jgi:hypothetical protein
VGLAVVSAAVCVSAPVAGQRGGGAPAAPATPRSAAPIDLTGYWVSIVSEDWRFRMVTPAKGDFQNIPMTAEAVRVANTWDPEADERAGQACRSYGAPAIMRVPGRLRITWRDETTLQLDTDAGMQSRGFRFTPALGAPAAPSWQGSSVASWERSGGGANSRANGSLRVVTTRLRPGYLRKNGIPYSENAVLTEYFDVVADRAGTPWLVVTSIVEDPRYLTQPFVLSTQFKKQPDAAGWDPTPCSSTW